MNLNVPEINLAMAWLWILAGFLTGIFLGLKFQDNQWLGGYSSFPRRMYRLGHISFFGLGGINFLFYFTVRTLPEITILTQIAAFALVVGALSMPLCCVLMAQSKRFQFSFGVPVLSLLLGASLTLLEILKL